MWAFPGCWARHIYDKQTFTLRGKFMLHPEIFTMQQSIFPSQNKDDQACSLPGEAVLKENQREHKMAENGMPIPKKSFR